MSRSVAAIWVSFLCTLPMAAKVRDWFFLAHAGNTGGRTLQQLNSDLQKGVEKDGFATAELIGKDSILEANLRGRGQKPWFESRNPGGDGKQILKADAASPRRRSPGSKGHEPRKIRFADGMQRETGEMFQRDGVLFLVDTGMSKGVGNSEGAILRVEGKNRQEAIAICADGGKTTIWDDRNRPKIGKAAPCGR